MAKRYILTQSQYRKKLRNEERIMKLKDIIQQAHNITKLIRREPKKVTRTLQK